MSGTLLPSATKASPTYSYYGSGGGSGGATINAQFINASTITLSPTGTEGEEYGMTIINETGAANGQVVGTSSASFSVISGSSASLSVQGNSGSLFVGTGQVIDAFNNTVQLEQRFNEEAPQEAKTGVYIEAVNDFGAIVQLGHTNAAGEDGFVDVIGRMTLGGATLASTMSITLSDGQNNLLSALSFDENGLSTGNMTITNLTLTNDLDVPNLTTGGYVRTQQSTGVNTQHQVHLFNTADIDIGQLMPMASIRNATGGLEYASDSKIAQFGMMAPGSNFMTIPGTTYAAASDVVLAPYTTLELYTGGSGSGGSTQYVNQGNAYFSTFTAEAYLNGNTFNSYKMFFGN